MKRRYSGTFLFELYGRLCFFGIDGEIYLLEKISEEILFVILSMKGSSIKEISIRKGMIAHYKAVRLMINLIPFVANLEVRRDIEVRRNIIELAISVFKRESRIKFSQTKKSLECHKAYINAVIQYIGVGGQNVN